MCGIAGWAARGAGAEASALAGMLDALAHRQGAADTLSALIDRHPRRSVVLGASLIDRESGIALALDGSLLEAAALRAELGRRGYRFADEGEGAGSHSEVLLRAYQHWDKEVVKHLRGAFAFAIWDPRKDRLMLARDRFGQKPLYVAEHAGALYFASEMRALACVPGLRREVDVSAVAEYLALRYVRGPRTLISGVRKLAPATYALWQHGTLRESGYWALPDGEAPASAPASGREPVARFIEALDESVRAHMPPGGPVGALLSRGYDSAAIVALMKRHSAAVETVSAGFAEDPRSELVAAGELARHFGTRHHEMVLQPRELLAALPALIERRDAPFCRPADIALHLIARQIAGHVRLALSGDGGDEILGGYRRHTFLRGLARKPARPGGLFIIPVEPREQAAAAGGGSSALRRILYYEQRYWLADNVLERAERMATRAALELRMPFADHRFAEHVSTLPDAQRVRGLSTKWILRKADERLLKDAPGKPRKGGFRIPLAGLLRGEMRDLLDYLRGPACVTRAYCDGAVLDRLLGEHLAVRRNHEEILWTLLNLEIWHRNYRAAAATTAPRALSPTG
jgi:asparagine synthase (glutamine-hydrolysing)